jgi:Spy/CpxP family protein refolding chaperone
MTADAGKTARKPRSIEDEIAKTAAKLKKLQDEQRERLRKERERNQKAVLELLRAEGLDEIPAEQWKERLEAVKAALGRPGETPLPAKSAQGGPPAAVADGASV